MGPYKVDKLAVPQTPLPQQAGTAQAIFKFIVRCITYRGTNSLLLKTIASSSSTASYFIMAGILRLGTVVSTHVALLLEGRRNMDYSNLSILLSKAFLSEGSWLPKVRDKGTRTQLSMMSHICRILPYLLGSCAFNRHSRPRGISPTLQGWTRPMSSDLIVKLLFPVAESAQMGLQMALAITTFTGLLYNCFRTRPISRHW